MNSPTEKTPLELYTGLSRHDLYDSGSANRRPCIWKIGDMVQTSPYSKSYDAGCYGKIVKIEKSTNDNRDSSSFGDSWWTCYYQVMGPESKSNQIGKIWGMRDYCYDPYQPEKKPVQESVNIAGNVKKSNGYQKNPLLEHSGIHSDIMKLVEAITAKYPTSRDLAVALRQFSAEQGGNAKLDKYAYLLDRDMDTKQYQRYLTNLIPLSKFRMFMTQFLGGFAVNLSTGMFGGLIGHKIAGPKGMGIGGAAGIAAGLPLGLKAQAKIHDWNLNRDYKKLSQMSVDDILRKN